MTFTSVLFVLLAIPLSIATITVIAGTVVSILNQALEYIAMSPSTPAQERQRWWADVRLSSTILILVMMLLSMTIVLSVALYRWLVIAT